MTLLNVYFHSKAEEVDHLNIILETIIDTSHLLVGVNSAANFFLYCMLRKNFRIAAWSILTCKAWTQVPCGSPQSQTHTTRIAMTSIRNGGEACGLNGCKVVNGSRKSGLASNGAKKNAGEALGNRQSFYVTYVYRDILSGRIRSARASTSNARNLETAKFLVEDSLRRQDAYKFLTQTEELSKIDVEKENKPDIRKVVL